MATIHFTGGEKGGVGKSLVARLIAQYFIDRQVPFLGFDTDRSHGALLRFYAAYASPVLIDRYESLDSVLEAAVENPERAILIDLAAQTHQPLVKWMDESGVLELADELGLKIQYWHVMDSGKDSVDLLKKLMDKFEDRLNYVVVLNELRGDNFSLFEQSGEKQRALELNAKLLKLSRLHEPVIAKIDAHDASFWAAANSPDKSISGLNLIERQRIKVWLRNTYAEFDKVLL